MHPREAWARAWSECEAMAWRAAEGWRQFPGAVQVAPMTVGRQGFAARIEAFAEPLPGLRRPAITYQASGQAVSWSELVQLVALQIRCGHLPSHGGG